MKYVNNTEITKNELHAEGSGYLNTSTTCDPCANKYAFTIKFLLCQIDLVEIFL